MIIQPDFPDHWKTQLLVARLGEQAVRVLLRLWGYCQTAKCCYVPKDPVVLAAICRFGGDPEELKDALLEAKFLACKRGRLQHFMVHDFALINASLFASWSNGKSGGRPPKKHSRALASSHKGLTDNHTGTDTGVNPRDTHRKPTGNPRVKTHGIPTGKDRIVREEVPPVVPPGDPTHGDEIHKILKGCGMLAGLTYELDLRARQTWPLPPEQVAACARAAAQEAGLWVSPPEQPALWWRKRLEKWHDETAKKTAGSSSREFRRMSLEEVASV